MSDTGLEEKTFCPLGSKCVEAKDGVIHRCEWHAKIQGPNPNTGEKEDQWRCAMFWMPYLIIENSLFERQTGAAVEKFRNEMVKANEVDQRVLLETARISTTRHFIEGKA
jgi:hypothetical protein